MIYRELISRFKSDKNFKIEYSKYKQLHSDNNDLASLCFIARMDNDAILKEKALKIVDAKKKSYYENKNVSTLKEVLLSLSEFYTHFCEGIEDIECILNETTIVPDYHDCGLLDALGTAAFLTRNIKLCSSVCMNFEKAVQTTADEYGKRNLIELDKSLKHLTHLKNIAYEFSYTILDIAPLYEIIVYLTYLYNPAGGTFIGYNDFLPSSDFLAAVALPQNNLVLQIDRRARIMAAYFIENSVYADYGYYTLLNIENIKKGYTIDDATLPYAADLKNGYFILGANMKGQGNILSLNLQNNSLGLAINGDEYFTPENGARRSSGNEYKIIKNEFADDTHVFIYKRGDFTRTVITCAPHTAVIIDNGYIEEEISFKLENDTKVHVYNESRIVLRKGSTALKLFSMGRFTGTESAEEEIYPSSVEKDLCIRWKSAQKNSVAVYTLIGDVEENIRMWHITKDKNHIHIEPPEKEKYIDFEINKNSIKIIHNNGLKDEYLI